MVTTSHRSFSVVTGATGHVGNALVRRLVAEGQGVRAVVHPDESVEALEGIDVQVARADVRDPWALLDAFRGAARVYHLAGIVDILPGRRGAMQEVNVVGTRNVVRACLEKRVERLVYTSSVHALPEPPRGRSVSEPRFIDPDRPFGDYGRSKARATLEVMHGVENGLDAVIVYPSGVVGPYDFRLSEMGRLLLGVVTGRLRLYVDGAYDFVDVRDLADGLVRAMELGGRGEGYLMSGHEVAVRDLMHMLGGTFRQLRVPLLLAQAWAVLSPAWARLLNRRPLFTTYSLRVLRSNCLMDRSKAERELGYRVRPFEETIEGTLRWFRSVGWLDEPAGAGSSM